MNPKVTVVTRAHGSAPYLETTIESVIAQANLDQMVVVIDKPEEPLLEIELRYRGAIDFVHLDKSNLSRAMNLGIRISRNDLIANIDSDDTMYLDRLKIQSEYLEMNSSIPLIGTNYSTLGEQGNILDEIKMPKLISRGSLNRWSPCPMIHSSIMFRKNSILEVGGYDENFAWAEDLDLYYRLNRFYNLVNLQTCLTSYRIYAGQSTAKNFKTISNVIVQSKIENQIIKNGFLSTKGPFKFVRTISFNYYLLVELVLLKLNSISKKNKQGFAFFFMRILLLIIDPKRKIRYLRWNGKID